MSEELAVLQAELARERTAQAETDAALDDARVTARNLQTRLGHMELELREMRERAAPVLVPVAVTEKKAAPARAVRVSKPKVMRVEKEPQPVKWWIKK